MRESPMSRATRANISGFMKGLVTNPGGVGIGGRREGCGSRFSPCSLVLVGTEGLGWEANASEK